MIPSRTIPLDIVVVVGDAVLLGPIVVAAGVGLLLPSPPSSMSSPPFVGLSPIIPSPRPPTSTNDNDDEPAVVVFCWSRILGIVIAMAIPTIKAPTMTPTINKTKLDGL